MTSPGDAPALRLVGHKGADLIAPGNTVESFVAAVEAGVDTIELDVLWLRDAHLPAGAAGAAGRRPRLARREAADAADRWPRRSTPSSSRRSTGSRSTSTSSCPAARRRSSHALRERGLVERAMVSTMELYSLGRILELEPKLRRGWTYPKVTKDWTSKRWAKAPMLAALVAMRHRLPGLAAESCPSSGSRRCGSTTR